MSQIGKFPRHLYAWMGMDELGSGQVGIKQGIVPAGPFRWFPSTRPRSRNTSPNYRLKPCAMGRKLYLVRYTVEEVVLMTDEGTALE